MAAPPGALPFSASVRSAAAALGGERVTASAFAQMLGSRHPEYADGLFVGSPFDVDAGEPRPVDDWLQDVVALYDPDALAVRSVIDTQLVLLGLAALDPPLRAALQTSGALDALLRVATTRPSGLAAPAGPREVDVVLAQDVVGTRPLTADDDLLGIEEDVQTLARLFLLREATPPLAAGLFGDWGTGKSFFLERLRSRIDELQVQARTTAGGIALCEHVVQVRFNAWHYMDADLWASLTSRIFETLDDGKEHHHQLRERFREHLEAASGQLADATAAAKAAEADDRQTRVDESRERSRQLRAAVRIARRAADAPERAVHAALGLPGGDEDLEPLRATLEDAALRVDRGVLVRWAGGFALAAALVIAAAVALDVSAVTAAVTSVVAVIAAAAGAARTVSGAIARGQAARERLRDQLDALEEKLDQEEARTAEVREAALTAREAATRAQAAVDDIRRGGLLRPLIHEGASAYRSRLGFLSQVRGDLEDMAALFDPESVDRRGGDPERIILYIDDLDRCPPERVVDVLQALHLLLAFPLFVVVVAVDSRWLVTSLEVHFERLVGGPASGGAALATDYLEKIFQLPIGLRPLDETAYRALVGGIVGRSVAQAEGTQVDARAPVAAAAAAADAPGVLARLPLPGRPLAVHFTADGRTCIAATTAGVFRWDRGRRGLRELVRRELKLAAISVDAEHVAALTDDDRPVAIDVLSGELHVAALRQPDVRQLAPLPGGRVVVLELDGSAVTVVDMTGGRSESHVVDGAREFALSADGRFLLVFADEGWRPLTLPLDDDRLFESTRGAVPGIGASPSRAGEFLVAARDGVRLVSLTGERDAAAIVSGTSAGVRGAVTGPAGRSADGWWVLTTDGLGLCPVVGGEIRFMANVLVQGVSALATDPDAERFVAWGAGELVIADAGGARHRVSQHVELAAVGARGGLAAILDGETLALWSIGDHADQPSELLALTDPEMEFLSELGDLVPTARAAKRLVNVYRVLRGSAALRARLTAPDPADHRFVLVLLALVVSWPGEATRLCDAVEAAADVVPRTALHRLARRQDASVLPVVEALVDVHGLAFERERWDAWAPHVTRFLVPPRRRARRR